MLALPRFQCLGQPFLSGGLELVSRFNVIDCGVLDRRNHIPVDRFAEDGFRAVHGNLFLVLSRIALGRIQHAAVVLDFINLFIFRRPLWRWPISRFFIFAKIAKPNVGHVVLFDPDAGAVIPLLAPRTFQHRIAGNHKRAAVRFVAGAPQSF